MARLDYKLRKKVIIPEFQDELGIYKICRICGAKFYYKDYDIELAKKVPQYAKRMNILKQSWNRKTTCSHACQDVRTEQIKQEFRAFVQQAKNKKYTCITCGTEFPFKSTSQYSSLRYCTKACSDMDFSLTTLANELGVTKDRFRNEMILLADKITKEKVI